MNDKIIEQDLEQIINSQIDWGKFDNKTYMISGANSFLMSYFIYTLLERNRTVGTKNRIIALCHNEQNVEKRFKKYLNDEGLRIVMCDITRQILCDEKVDYCIHAASPAGIKERQVHQAETFNVNVLGTYQMLEYCRHNSQCKFLLVSSVDVYGKVNGSKRLKEEDIGTLDILYPRNAYSNGKRAAETLTALYCKDYGVNTVVVRPYQVYGPGMNIYDGRLHGDFVRQLLDDSRIVLKSDGTAIRSFMYLVDATLAFFKVLDKGVTGQVYNVCDEDGEASVKELADIYVQVFSENVRVEFEFEHRNTPEVKEAISRVVGDGTKLRELGFVCETSLEEGIKKTLTYYT